MQILRDSVSTFVAELLAGAVVTALKAARQEADYPIVIHARLSGAALALLVGASVAVVSGAPSAPPSGRGCQCATTPAAMLESVDHIFVGDIVEVKGGGEGTATAVVRVRESLKGPLAGVVEVRDAAATDCSWSVFEMAGPGRYVIFANDDEGELVTPAFCPQTQPISGLKDKLPPLRAAARAAARAGS
jgi:hypothetical protein